MIALDSIEQDLRNWLNLAIDEDWLGVDQISALDDIESLSADALFDKEESIRPLTIGFFGGTGVGKSSLLNRLAGEELAQVGVRRPTSTQVTVYAHKQKSISLEKTDLPLEKTKILYHQQNHRKDLVWVDMPDIDSIQVNHHELVLKWLPFLDWLIYVVSPERYRDDVSWRIIKDRDKRHHWLFVMNHFDTGSQQQIDDFEKLLSEGGFPKPKILTTSCLPHQNDDFDQIEATINQAVQDHGLAKLERLGILARIDDLKFKCDQFLGLLGSDDQWEKFRNTGSIAYERQLHQLNNYFNHEVALMVEDLPDSLKKDQSFNTVPDFQSLLKSSSADYFQDMESKILLLTEGLPSEPIMQNTRDLRSNAKSILAETIEQGFKMGMAMPGNTFQRGLQRSLGVLTMLLPLLVSSWTVYYLVIKYRAGITGEEEFLGINFFMHSSLLIILSALIPYLLKRITRPSIRKSIKSRIRHGLVQASEKICDRWSKEMKTLMINSKELKRDLLALKSRLGQV